MRHSSWLRLVGLVVTGVVGLCGCASTDDAWSEYHKEVAAWEQAKKVLPGMPLTQLNSCASPPIARRATSEGVDIDYYVRNVYFGGRSSITCVLTVHARDGKIGSITTDLSSTGGAHRDEEICVFTVQGCLGLREPIRVVNGTPSFVPGGPDVDTSSGAQLAATAGMLSQLGQSVTGGGRPMPGTVPGTGAAPSVALPAQPRAQTSGYVGMSDAAPVAASSSTVGDQSALIANLEAKIVEARVVRAGLPATIDGCPATVDHIAGQLARCPGNAFLLKMREYALLTDASFRTDLNQGWTLKDIAIQTARIARESNEALAQTETSALEASADADRTLARFAKLKANPPECDAGAPGSFGMNENAYQAYVSLYFNAVLNRAVSAIAACRARASK